MNLTEEDINQVEQFMRNEGLNYLEKKLRAKIDETADFLLYNDQCIDYFGETYANDPSNFRFEIGDKKLIRFLRDHIIKNQDSKGSKYMRRFRKKKSRTEKLIDRRQRMKNRVNKTDHENVVENRKRSVVNYSDGDNDDEYLQGLRDKLFQSLGNYLKSFVIQENVLEKFSQNNVSVAIVNGAIIGEVFCFICENGHDEKTKKAKLKGKKVYYEVTNSSKFWVCSNFGKHLKNAHKIHKLDSAKDSSFCGNSSLVDKNSDAANDTSNSIAGSSADSISKNHTNEPKAEELALANNFSIEYVTVAVDPSNEEALGQLTTDLGRNMFTQISEQIRKIFEAKLSNGDSTEEMFYNLLRIDSDSLEVALVARDGNCLFRSIVHQLFGNKLNTVDQTQETRELRQKVVEHIGNHYSRYKFALQGRVYDEVDANEIQDLDEECKNILNNRLPLDYYWGGSETFKAVREIYEVNILVFNENGVCFFANEFNVAFTRTLILAYRLKFQDDNDSSDEDDELRDHYDSVCDISTTKMLSSINYLIDTLTRSNAYNDETL